LSPPAAGVPLLQAVQPLLWRQLDDEWVVFGPDSGVLTALDAFNATVLDSLGRGARSAEDVVSMLAHDIDPPLIAELTSKVALVLASLVSSGLAQAVEP
jgi:hypothetical protein